MQQNFSTWFRSLQILFFSLLLGQLLISILLYTAVAPPPAPGRSDWTLYLLPVMAIQAAIGFVLCRNKIAAARSLAGLSEKLGAYRTALMLKWALLEAPTMIALILYFFVSPQPLLLGAAALLIGVSATQGPSRDKLFNDLELSPQEQMLLDDPNYII